MVGRAPCRNQSAWEHRRAHTGKSFFLELKKTEENDEFVRWSINADHFLVGGWATPLKNMKVNWDDYSQYMGK